MKKIIPIIMSAVIMLSSCSKPQEDNGRIKVYTSFYAVNEFAKAVGGEDADCESIVPSGAEPHDFEPTASDMAKLTEADVFIYNGAGMEHWAEDVVKTLPDTVTIKRLSDILSDEIIIDGDPHIWLDTSVASAIVSDISRALANADSANSDKYIKRGDEYAKRISELYNEYASAGLEGKKLFVTHGAYGYLCAEFGMEQIALEGISGDSDPSPAQTAKIVDEIKKSGAKCIFYDPLEGTKNAEAVAKEAGVTFLPLYTFEGDTENRDYIAVMSENLKQLKAGL